MAVVVAAASTCIPASTGDEPLSLLKYAGRACASIKKHAGLHDGSAAVEKLRELVRDVVVAARVLRHC